MPILSLLVRGDAGLGNITQIGQFLSKYMGREQQGHNDEKVAEFHIAFDGCWQIEFHHIGEPTCDPAAGPVNTVMSSGQLNLETRKSAGIAMIGRNHAG